MNPTEHAEHVLGRALRSLDLIDAVELGYRVPRHTAVAAAVLCGLRPKIRQYFPVGSGMNDWTGEAQRAYERRMRIGT